VVKKSERAASNGKSAARRDISAVKVAPESMR
jgi:hypothetical protein